MIDRGLVMGLVLHKVPVAKVLMAKMQENISTSGRMVGFEVVWAVFTCGHLHRHGHEFVCPFVSRRRQRFRQT